MHIVEQAKAISEGISMASAHLKVLQTFQSDMGLNEDAQKILADALQELEKASNAAFDIE